MSVRGSFGRAAAAALAALLLGSQPAAAEARAVALLGSESPLHDAPLEAAPGSRLIVWRLADRGAAAPPLELVVLRLDPAVAGWKVVPVGRSGPRAGLLDSAGCGPALAVTSGGFFAAAEQGGYRPLGLAVGDGVELSPFSPRRWGGVLVRAQGETAILPISGFSGEGWDQALQSSPVVVDQGANDMLGDDGRLDNRLAIGLDGEGALLAIGAFRDDGAAVSLWRFAELILALQPAAGITVTTALALDGGSSAQFAVPALGLHWGSPWAGYMPNALCLGL